jgi:SET domain
MPDDTSNRLEAIDSLVKLYRARYPQGAFECNEALTFTTSGATGGISARAKNNVSRDEYLLRIPDEEYFCRQSAATFKPTAVPARPKDDGGGGTTTPSANPMLDLDLVQTLNIIEQRVVNEVGVGEDPNDFVLAALIVFAWARKKDSPFHQAMATWPTREEIRDTFFWTEDDLKPLASTWTARRIQDGRRTQEKVFRQAFLPVLQEQGIEHCCTSETNKTLEESFRCAHAMVKSRCHAPADIIPLVDLVNGLPEGSKDINAILRYSTFRQLDHSTASCAVLCATRDIMAGEEILISYGPLPPYSFIYKYGCCPKQYLDGKFMLDMVDLSYPPDLLCQDKGRLGCLERLRVPATKEEIDKCFNLCLSPMDWDAYAGALHGLGGEPPTSSQWKEPVTLKLLQNIILLMLLPYELLAKLKKVKNKAKHMDKRYTGKVLLRVMDYNLAMLPMATSTNMEELAFLEACSSSTTTTRLSTKARVAVMGRVMYRDALARWRHAICRHHDIFAASDTQIMREAVGLNHFGTLPTPPCLKLDG